MSLTSTPVGRAQEMSRITLKAHPYECHRTIPKLLSSIQKLETIVISLMSERISRRATNMDHSHLAPNEVKSDIKSFSTLIHAPPAEVEYNNLPVIYYRAGFTMPCAVQARHLVRCDGACSTSSFLRLFLRFCLFLVLPFRFFDVIVLPWVTVG